MIEKVGELDYKLDLPHWLKVHPTFHVNRLSPWHDQGVNKPPPPKPVQVGGEEEYIVEKILDSRVFRRQLQYKVRWKGFEAKDDTWEPSIGLYPNAQEAISEFH